MYGTTVMASKFRVSKKSPGVLGGSIADITPLGVGDDEMFVGEYNSRFAPMASQPFSPMAGVKSRVEFVGNTRSLVASMICRLNSKRHRGALAGDRVFCDVGIEANEVRAFLFYLFDELLSGHAANISLLSVKPFDHFPCDLSEMFIAALHQFFDDIPLGFQIAVLAQLERVFHFPPQSQIPRCPIMPRCIPAAMNRMKPDQVAPT